MQTNASNDPLSNGNVRVASASSKVARFDRPASRPVDDVVEFTLVSFWDSMEAVRRYAGPDPERPNYYDEHRASPLEFPERADHRDVLDAAVRA